MIPFLGGGGGGLTDKQDFEILPYGNMSAQKNKKKIKSSNYELAVYHNMQPRMTGMQNNKALNIQISHKGKSLLINGNN